MLLLFGANYLACILMPKNKQTKTKQNKTKKAYEKKKTNILTV